MFNSQEEVCLKDYCKVLVESKILIGVIFLIALIGGVIFSVLQPKIYKVDVWLEIGKAKNVLIEEPMQIVRKIREGIYGDCQCGKMEAIVANKTNLIQIKINAKDSEKAKEFLIALSSHITLEHNKIINKERVFIEERIEKDKKEIELWEGIRKKIGVNVADPIYQMMFLFAGLNIEGRENNIKAFRLSFNGVSETKVIKEPNIILPSQIKKILLNTAIFGLIGLFFGVILTFWKKW